MQASLSGPLADRNARELRPRVTLASFAGLPVLFVVNDQPAHDDDPVVRCAAGAARPSINPALVTARRLARGCNRRPVTAATIDGATNAAISHDLRPGNPLLESGPVPGRRTLRRSPSPSIPGE